LRANFFTNVQGFKVPPYYYESFRTSGFPAAVQHHVTVGVGYNVIDKFIFNISYRHAYATNITATGTNPFGQPASFRSRLSEDSVDVGFSVRF